MHVNRLVTVAFLAGALRAPVAALELAGFLPAPRRVGTSSSKGCWAWRSRPSGWCWSPATGAPACGPARGAGRPAAQRRGGPV